MRGHDTGVGEADRGLSVATRKSVLDEGSLSRAIQVAYGLSPATYVRLYRISGSDVYQVADQGNTWFLKVYRSTAWDARRARTAVTAIETLGQHGFPVPELWSSENGDALVTLEAAEGDRLAYMYQSVLGPEPRETDEAEGYRFGVTAATMHQLMDELASPHDFPIIDYEYLFGRYLSGIEELLSEEVASIRFLRRLAEALWEDVVALLPQAPPHFGFCHGDMHTGNAVLTSSGKVTLLDFDACGYGWRVIDIGTYYVSFDWLGLDPASREKRRQILAHFLRGYNAVRQLAVEELKSLDLFMAIRHFELLGIGIGRMPFTGSHWVNSRQLHAYVAWFREWLEVSGWFGERHVRELNS